MTSSQTIRELTWPITAFGRSTNVKLGFSQDIDSAPFRFTNKSVALFSSILDCWESKSKDRAFSVIGPYGSGKSSFALFLTAMLSKTSSSWVAQCLQNLELTSPITYERARQQLEKPDKGFFPIVLQGEKIRLDLALCKGLLEAFESPVLDCRWIPTELQQSVHSRILTLEEGVNATGDVVDLYKQTAAHAKASGYQGLLVIGDEFGKYLEVAADTGDIQDIVAAQYLAELAASTNDPDLLFIVLLHQNFQSYGPTISQSERLEWGKIQGRFSQIDFSGESEDLYELISACLGRGNVEGLDDARIQDWASAVYSDVESVLLFQGQSKEEFWKRQLPEVYPFHPVALYGLPRLSARLGQNERTLFTFLVSDDPLGLKRFLTETEIGDGLLPSLGFDLIVDYFLYGAKFSAAPPDIRKTITQLESALERLGDRPDIEKRILKVLGGIQLLRAGPALPPNKSTLKSALTFKNAEEAAEFDSSLTNLVSSKLLVHRRFSDEYHLWEGSDFDFDQAIANERGDSANAVNIGDALPQGLLNRPVMAHQHSIQTGHARVFGRIFKSTTELVDSDLKQIFQTEINGLIDGLIIHTAPANLIEIHQLTTWAEHIDDERILVTVPSILSNVFSLVNDLNALTSILENNPEIRDDPVAMKELSSRSEGISSMVEEDLTRLIEPAEHGPTWFWKGRALEIKDSRSLNRYLSNICDQLYPQAPAVVNELINRSRIPTAIFVAVKKIADGLVQEKGLEGLGFTGNGPEVSIFKTLFENTGLYQKKGSNWRITPPAKDDQENWHSVWTAIREYLEGSRKREQDLSGLFKLLENRPYGLKSGVNWLLIWAVLINHKDNLCLYFDGTYIRRWEVEIFDLFTKVPEKFTVRWLIAEQSTKTIVQGLYKGLPEGREVTRKVGVNTLLSRLYQWYRELPEYARQTSQLSDEAQALRRVITTTADPVDLLFNKIPVCLGLDPFYDGNTEIKSKYPKGTTSVLTSQFAERVDEIQTSYDRLLKQMVACMADVFQSRDEARILKERFKSDAAPVVDYVHDPQVKAFLDRACNGLEEADDKWIEALGAILTNQSPRSWIDFQLQDFKEKVALVGQELRDAKRRRFAVDRGNETQGLARLSFETSSGKHIEDILLPEQLDGPADNDASWLLAMLRYNRDDIPELERERIKQSLMQALLRVMDD